MIRNSTKFISNLLKRSRAKISSKEVVRCLSTEMNQLVKVDVNEKNVIATVTMNRPPVNSLNLELFEALSNTLDDLENDHSRGMILTSAHPSELKELIKPDAKRFQLFWTACQNVWLKLYGSSFPTAAAINVVASLPLVVNIASCVQATKLVLRLGIPASMFLLVLMRNTLSNRDAERALTLGKLFTTDEALKVGLIDEIAIDKPMAIDRCEKFLMQFKHVSSFARSHTKRFLREELIDHREKDLQTTLTNVTQPSVQKQLQDLLESLKSK